MRPAPSGLVRSGVTVPSRMKGQSTAGQGRCARGVGEHRHCSHLPRFSPPSYPPTTQRLGACSTVIHGTLLTGDPSHTKASRQTSGDRFQLCVPFPRAEASPWSQTTEGAKSPEAPEGAGAQRCCRHPREHTRPRSGRDWETGLAAQQGCGPDSRPSNRGQQARGAGWGPTQSPG